jgi:X-X-X-Leu-X-X-Gly heptad repeat protein
MYNAFTSRSVLRFSPSQKFTGHRLLAAGLLLGVMLFPRASFADGSHTMSKGSEQVSKGSVTLSDGASQLLASAGRSAVNFVVDSIEVAGDLAEITLISAAKTSQAAVTVSVNVAASTLSSLAIAAGTAINIMAVLNESQDQILGYLLLDGARVLIFVTQTGSTLSITSEKK